MGSLLSKLSTIFREDGYRWNDLDGFEVDFYYKRPKQKETIKQLTGNANYVEGFPGTDFLVRGHLAPVEDFMSNAYKVQLTKNLSYHPTSTEHNSNS